MFDPNAYPYLAQRKAQPMNATLQESTQNYIEIPKPHNLGEMLNTVTSAWKVKGPHGGDHSFKFIQCAEVVDWGILHQNIIRYHKDGDHRDDIKWGHDTVYAYQASEWKQISKREWRTGLLGHHVLENELPCCGGRFVFVKEVTGYSCIVFGNCGHCGTAWAICDGTTWTIEG
jgi:hypothetical protein